MTEPTPLSKAEAAVRSAETDTVAVQLALAAVELAKVAQQQATTSAPAPARQDFNATKWLTIGAVVCVGGVVGALFAVAVAIGAVSVAILALVLRAMWRDYQKGR